MSVIEASNRAIAEFSMLTKKANSEKLREKFVENFNLNRRFALSELISMSFSVHAGNLGTFILSGNLTLKNDGEC